MPVEQLFGVLSSSREPGLTCTAADTASTSGTTSACTPADCSRCMQPAAYTPVHHWHRVQQHGNKPTFFCLPLDLEVLSLRKSLDQSFHDSQHKNIQLHGRPRRSGLVRRIVALAKPTGLLCNEGAPTARGLVTERIQQQFGAGELSGNCQGLDSVQPTQHKRAATTVPTREHQHGLPHFNCVHSCKCILVGSWG